MKEPTLGVDFPYRELFGRHPQAMWVYDVETLHVLAVNDAAVVRYGYSRDEFLRLSIVDLRPQEEVPALRRNVVETADGFSESGPWRHRRKDGTEILVQITSQAIEFDGRAARLVIAHDVTARVESETKLRRAEGLLEYAARMARLGAWSMDVTTRQVEWSDEVCAIHDMPRRTSQALAAALSFCAPEWRSSISMVIENCISKGVPFDEEVQIITGKGRRRWVRMIGEAVRDRDGTMIGLQGALQDITDRKETAKSVLQSDLRFRQLADAMPQIVWTAEPDGTVDYASQPYYDLTGAPQAEGPANTWLTTLHEDDREPCLERWAHSLQTGEGYKFEFRLRRASDGAYRWHLVTASPIRDETGRIVKWYGAATDVHDRREADEAVQRLAARLNATLESISDGFCMVDRRWRYIFVNPETERRTGRSREDLIGKVMWDEFPEIVGSEFHVRCLRTMQTGQPDNYEDFNRDVQRWFDVSLYPSEEGLAIYFRDVTERHKAAARIRDYQARFETLVDNSIVGILVHVDLDLVFANRALAQMFGYDSVDEVMALDTAIELFADDERDRIRGYAANRRRGAAAPGLYHVRGKKRDGSIIDLENRAFVIEWSGRKAICATLIDVTAQRAMEEQLREAQRLEAVGQLTGGVAHDFNNLLTIITGNAELLAEGITDNGRLSGLAEMIRKAAGRGAELTNRLLAYARRQTLEPRAIDVRRQITGMEGLLRRTLGENVEIEVRTEESLWAALADAGQLENALLNLSINARDAMSEGGKLTIEVGNAQFDDHYVAGNADVRPGDYVMVAVSDTGTGMTPEVADRVFEPFFTTKEVGEGSGLGLSMVFGFVKQSQGHVQLYTEIGHGTTIKLYLPRATETDTPGAEPVPAMAEAPKGSESILLVEDDDLVRGHVCELLDSLGYHVVAAADGPAALDLLSRDGHYDLMFTDVVMRGGMNGRKLADEALKLRPSLPVLFMSGFTGTAMLRQGRLDLGLHFLGKPFRRDELAVKLRQVLEGCSRPG